MKQMEKVSRFVFLSSGTVLMLSWLMERIFFPPHHVVRVAYSPLLGLLLLLWIGLARFEKARYLELLLKIALAAVTLRICLEPYYFYVNGGSDFVDRLTVILLVAWLVPWVFLRFSNFCVLYWVLLCAIAGLFRFELLCWWSMTQCPISWSFVRGWGEVLGEVLAMAGVLLSLVFAVVRSKSNR